MIVVNFSHPLTDVQRAMIESLTQQSVERELRHMLQLDDSAPIADQVVSAIDAVELDGDAWQVEPILVLLPGLAPAAAVVLAEIHGRTGYFPTIARLRPVAGSTPLRFEVAELINLQSIRSRARRARI